MISDEQVTELVNVHGSYIYHRIHGIEAAISMVNELKETLEELNEGLSDTESTEDQMSLYKEAYIEARDVMDAIVGEMATYACKVDIIRETPSPPSFSPFLTPFCLGILLNRPLPGNVGVSARRYVLFGNQETERLVMGLRQGDTFQP